MKNCKLWDAKLDLEIGNADLGRQPIPEPRPARWPVEIPSWRTDTWESTKINCKSFCINLCCATLENIDTTPHIPLTTSPLDAICEFSDPLIDLFIYFYFVFVMQPIMSSSFRRSSSWTTLVNMSDGLSADATNPKFTTPRSDKDLTKKFWRDRCRTARVPAAVPAIKLAALLSPFIIEFWIWYRLHVLNVSWMIFLTERRSLATKLAAPNSDSHVEVHVVVDKPVLKLIVYSEFPTTRMMMPPMRLFESLERFASKYALIPKHVVLEDWIWTE